MRNIRLPQLQNVGPNQRATLRFPLGHTYEKVQLFLGTNITTALITNIVLKLNNKEFQRWASAADMVTGLLAYKGNHTGDNTLLTFDFTERSAKEEVGMKLGTIAATAEAGVQDMTLEFDLGNYASVAGSTIGAWADIEAPSGNPIIMRVQHQQRGMSAAVEENIYVPYGAQGVQVKRLIIKHASLDYVRVRRDGVDIFEGLPVALANKRATDYGRTPQAGFYVLDFMPDGLQSNAFNTAFLLVPQAGGSPKKVPVQSLDVRVKTTAADTLTIYTESYSLNSAL